MNIIKCCMLFFLCSLSNIFCNQTPDHPLIVVVLMVKNEESVMVKTLQPFVDGGITSFLIFDTGSTDSTVAVTKEFFQQHNVTDWYLFEEPFVDFSTSRNRALDLAEEKFPQATFFLMPDAEWYLHNVHGLIDFCRQEAHSEEKCYLIRVIGPNLDFPSPRLIRAGTQSRFVGLVHESIVTYSFKKMPGDIYFELGCSRCGIAKSQKRWERDVVLLQKSYEENPHDPRTVFYLGQTYECLCDFENAYKYYEIRSKQNGFIEENFETFYRLGRVTDILSQSDKRYTWHMAQDYYFMAHAILPHRAEPLVKIAEHYWPDGSAPVNIALCYLFAKHAFELPYPEHDLLFVDPESYHFKRYELLSKSAWHMANFELGETATRKALQCRELPHLLRNLACYVEAKKIIAGMQK